MINIDKATRNIGASSKDTKRLYTESEYTTFECEGSTTIGITRFEVNAKREGEIIDVEFGEELGLHAKFVIDNDMNVDEILKFFPDANLPLMVKHHNQEMKRANDLLKTKVRYIDDQKVDSVLLLSLLQQQYCVHCAADKVNIWCTRCGQWQHLSCNQNRSRVNDTAEHFICSRCE